MQKLLITFFIFFLAVGSTTAVNAEESEFQNSEYTSGVIQFIETDENDYTLYNTLLKNGIIIDLDTFGEELAVGDEVFVEYFKELDTYNYATVKRTSPLIWLLAIFMIAVLVLSRIKGVRSLIALLLSILLLFGALVPLIMNGWHPVWTTLIFGLLVLAISIFVTHGFNRQSLVSWLGSFSSIVVAAILVEIVTATTSMTGLINDHIQFLSFEMKDSLHLVHIVTAGIIIGILGVLDDITITQVAVVRELSSDEKLSKQDIFRKAIRVGRDHISSLVNTLVFAYMGAALPLILFVSILDIPFWVLVSQEFIFVEVVRSLVGAIGLTIAVPITTYLASFVFLDSIRRDQSAIDSACGHTHHSS